ncbi:hypothetical protein BJY24_001761 [Nocardia transvalensis]|uniref:Uncharacterized protein n=1 Tax=Nocardia transvalensis TaxID=37333 RepID=A0A7W9PB95_9NOCA|nr:hypothetical protein [Nocardia transvalensis]MBB5912894.1 hypothetical protein [Nocardia transvalensis]
MASVPLDEQKVLDTTIGRTVLQELYEDENSAELTVELVQGRVRVRVTSDTRTMIMPSDELLQAVGQLAAAHEREGTGFSGAVYRYQKQPSGRWSMEGDFSYAG